MVFLAYWVSGSIMTCAAWAAAIYLRDYFNRKNRLAYLNWRLSELPKLIIAARAAHKEFKPLEFEMHLLRTEQLRLEGKR